MKSRLFITLLCFGSLLALGAGRQAMAQYQSWPGGYSVPGGFPPQGGPSQGGYTGPTGYTGPSTLTTVGGPIAALAGSYKLGPQDALSIFVDKHPEFSNPHLVVPPDGQIALPAAGSFRVNGKTVAQVQKAIQERLSHRLLLPQVTVTIVELRDASLGYVSVVGDVNKPGFVPIREGWRLTELLAAVGETTGRLDETRATLARRGHPPQIVDLYKAVSYPLSKANVKVDANDVLSVIQQEPKRFSINGDVNKPDVYEIRKSPRLLDAIVAAGGLKQRPDLSTGWIQRKGVKIALDLDAAIDLKNPTANIALQPGDFISIEAIPPVNVSVVGEVHTPGNFALETNAGILTAIAQAGGLATTPDKIVATIHRGQQIINVDLQRALLTTDVSADVPLRNGDLLMLADPEIIRVQVTGSVTHPGPYRLAPTARVLDGLSEAGGLMIPAKTAQIALLRSLPDGTQKVINLDSTALTDLRDVTQNMPLKDGDLLNVAELSAQNAYISGEVAKPGSYPIQPGDGVPELIAQAGGPTELALLSHVTVQRGQKSFQVDVFDTMRHGGKKPDFVLQNGDFVVVEQNKQKVLVMEAVAKPGIYPIPENASLTLGEALALAGGIQNGDTKQVTVLRKGPNDTIVRQVIQLTQIGKGNLQSNIVLRPDDIVYVPDLKNRPSVLNSASQFSFLWRIFGF